MNRDFTTQFQKIYLNQFQPEGKQTASKNQN